MWNKIKPILGMYLFECATTKAQHEFAYSIMELAEFAIMNGKLFFPCTIEGVEELIDVIIE